jgi:hypothetical protein
MINNQWSFTWVVRLYTTVVDDIVACLDSGCEDSDVSRRLGCFLTGHSWCTFFLNRFSVSEHQQGLYCASSSTHPSLASFYSVVDRLIVWLGTHILPIFRPFRLYAVYCLYWPELQLQPESLFQTVEKVACHWQGYLSEISQQIKY